jgi:putative GTP pyrophosphokinase
MAEFEPTAEQEGLIDELVAHYVANQGPIKRFLESLHAHLSESDALTALTHSLKRRMKSQKSLKDKLLRKLEKDGKAGVPFHITQDNLFTEIIDLGGYRILHLHTRQMNDINKALMQVLEEAQCTIVEGPKANVWDKETETYFQSIGINTEYNPRMYSSVHYVVSPHKSKANVRVEIQIRSLSEEIWGEVDHKFNYPHPIESVACGEQIKVLARVASSCTRLVDSIFASVADFKSEEQHAPPPADEVAHPAAEPQPAVQADAVPEPEPNR